MTDLSSWIGSNCTLATVTEGTGVNAVSFLRVTRTGANPYIQSPAGRTDNGKIYRMLRAKVRKHVGTVATTFVGRLSWTTAGHGFSASYKNELSAPSGKSTDEWFDLTWDNTSPTAGGTDWSDNTITQLKIEFSNTAGDVWDVLAIAVGNTSATPWTDTPQVIPNAITKASMDSSAGPYTLPRIGLSPPANWILLNQITVTLSGYGVVRCEWIGQIDHNNNDYAYISLLIDNAPTFDGAGLINNWDKQVSSKAISAYTLTCALLHKATGLSAGSHTFSVYGQQKINATNHTVNGPTLSIDEMKA